MKLLIAGLVLSFILLGWAAIERTKWLSEHCEVIGKISGDVGYGMSSSGSYGTVYIPGKTQYKCDDGLMYTE